jgi:hypothetical protein
VIEILRGDAHFTNREFSLGDIVKANRRCQLRQRDRCQQRFEFALKLPV